MVLPHFGKVEKIHHKDDSGFNVVTELDRKAELLLADRLKAVYPDIGFYGEEFGGSKDADRFWIVDPIDGTAHFVRGTPYCTTMIALIEEGKVVFSAIYNFVQDEMYVAERGKGATKNGKTISVSNRSLSEAYLGHEMKLDTPERIETFLKFDKHAILFKTITAGYEYALVASGILEGRICIAPFGQDYDYAPGSFLVEEAGGVVKNIGQDSYDFRNYDFIASNQKVFDELQSLGLV